jgi:hypothetical protein
MKALPRGRPPMSGLTLEQAAIAYAEVGLFVVPLLPHSKKAYMGAGVLDATNDVSAVAAHWHEHPRDNIGLALRPSGLSGLDIDGEHGYQLAAEAGAFTEPHPTVLTPRPGNAWHVYFARPPAGVETKFLDSAEVPQLRLQGDDAYLVLPPSVITAPPEKHAGTYRWT